MLKAPGNKAVRPTTGMVRESLFSILQADLQDARFLDLFAGSGLMGIEALSRGAALVLGVEQQRAHIRLIRENYAALGLGPELASVVQADVFDFIARQNKEAPFGIVFADPPYGLPGVENIADMLKQNGWLSSGGRLVIENDSQSLLPENYTRRQFGNTSLFFAND